MKVYRIWKDGQEHSLHECDASTPEQALMIFQEWTGKKLTQAPNDKFPEYRMDSMEKGKVGYASPKIEIWIVE
jgi:hypothetical protein